MIHSYHNKNKTIKYKQNHTSIIHTGLGHTNTIYKIDH